MHELAEIENPSPRENVEFFQVRTLEAPTLIRCPYCEGLRSVSHRHRATASVVCTECRRGNVVPRWSFCAFWVERFSADEIDEMAEAMWG